MTKSIYYYGKEFKDHVTKLASEKRAQPNESKQDHHYEFIAASIYILENYLKEKNAPFPHLAKILISALQLFTEDNTQAIKKLHEDDNSEFRKVLTHIIAGALRINITDPKLDPKSKEKVAKKVFDECVQPSLPFRNQFLAVTFMDVMNSIKDKDLYDQGSNFAGACFVIISNLHISIPGGLKGKLAIAANYSKRLFDISAEQERRDVELAKVGIHVPKLPS